MNRRRQPLEALNRWLSAFGQPRPDGKTSRFQRFLRIYLVYYPVLRPAYFALGVYGVHLASPGTFAVRGRPYAYFHHW